MKGPIIGRIRVPYGRNNRSNPIKIKFCGITWGKVIGKARREKSLAKTDETRRISWTGNGSNSIGNDDTTREIVVYLELEIKKTNKLVKKMEYIGGCGLFLIYTRLCLLFIVTTSSHHPLVDHQP